MKRKVLVVLPELETGGGQRMAISIVQRIKMPELQVRILVLYPRRGDILEHLADEYELDIQYLHKRSGADLRCIFEIYQAICTFRPDVIHAHLRVMPYLLVPMCFSGMSRRYYTVHNLAPKDAAGVRRQILKFAFHHCNVQPIAISELCRKSITETYGIPEQKIQCIYVGIDIKRFARPWDYEIKTPFRFGAVGRLSGQKNYPLMFRAFADIHCRFPNTELIIVGDGELKESLNALCAELELSRAVLFTGIIPDVEKYLWSAHAYLMSSDYEGLPQTVLEAMAAGLPVVSTRAGGVVDVVENGRNGFLVDCGDLAGFITAMENLLQSSELCKRFSDHSMALAQKYSIQACADRYKELYLE